MKYTQLITDAQEYQKGKVCNICKEHKPFSEFHKIKRNNDGLHSRCKPCQMEHRDNMCKFKKWFIRKRSRARCNGIEFTIEPTDIPGVKIRRFKVRGKWTWEATEYPKICPVLEVEIDWDKKKVAWALFNSPSLDRDNPTNGYIKGNVMIMSKLANSMKQNATTEQLNQFSRYHLFGDNK